MCTRVFANECGGWRKDIPFCGIKMAKLGLAPGSQRSSLRNSWPVFHALGILAIIASRSNFVKCEGDREVSNSASNLNPANQKLSQIGGELLGENLKEKRRQCIESDLFCKTPDLIRKYGYPAETHTAVTPDGFVLVAHRIAGRRRLGTQTPSPRGPVVILAHALLCSSSDWLMNAPDKALPYLLADTGADVWMLNSRGNSYSRAHLLYKDTQPEYWDWSFHEMGTVDVVTWIDYILSVSRQPHLYYVGHSMGSTQFFLGMSEFPEYNKKIRKMFALAPAVYVTHSRYWPLAQFSPVYGNFIKWRGTSRFLPETLRVWLHILGYGCTALEPICDNFLFFVAGYNPKQTNSSQTAVIASHTPDIVSSKTINHFLQIMRANKFQKYDYGYADNKIRYGGRPTPPEYNLTRVTAPVVLFHAKNDIFVSPTDAVKCAKELGNLQEIHLVEDDAFTHINFTYAIDADKYVYHKIIDGILADENKE